MTRPTIEEMVEYIAEGNSDEMDMAAHMVRVFGGKARLWAETNTVMQMAIMYVEGLDAAAFAALQDEIIDVMGED